MTSSAAWAWKGRNALDNAVQTVLEGVLGGAGMKTHNLFISHSWSYSDSYDRLENLLRSRKYFRFRNYSAPKDNPIHTGGTDRELYRVICNKIRLCHVVLVQAGVYATYSKWINKEIDIAKKEFITPTPIIAVRPLGSRRISAVVEKHANLVVSWNTESVVSAIRELTPNII